MSLSYCKLAPQALKRYGTGDLEIRRNSWLPMLADHISNVVSHRSINEHWDIERPDPFRTSLVRRLIECISCMAYGGLHLLAWNAPFRSRTEEWLWRSSRISVIVFDLSIVPLLLLVPSNVLRKPSYVLLEPSDGSKLCCCFRLFLFSVLGLFLSLVYVVARVSSASSIWPISTTPCMRCQVGHSISLALRHVPSFLLSPSLRI